MKFKAQDKQNQLIENITSSHLVSLAHWLSDQGIEYVLINPHLVKKNKENRDNTPSKSDRKDALVIADMIKTDTIPPCDSIQKPTRNCAFLWRTATR
jgi:transposase